MYFDQQEVVINPRHFENLLDLEDARTKLTECFKFPIIQLISVNFHERNKNDHSLQT